MVKSSLFISLYLFCNISILPNSLFSLMVFSSFSDFKSFNAFKNSSEKKIRPSSPTKRKALNLPLYKSPFVIKIDRDFQLKGNSCLVKDIGSKNSILNPQNSRKNESDKEGKKKMKSIEKEKEYQMKRMVLRQRTKSFCDLKAYFKNYEISQYINKIPFRKSI